MSKNYNSLLFTLKNYLFTFAFIGTLALTAAHAQNNHHESSLRTKLDTVFHDYDLIKLNPKEAAQTVRSGQSLEIKSSEKILELDLRPRNLLAPGYRAEETVSNGVRQALAAPQLRTFRGKAAGDDASQVRLTVTENEIEGVVVTNGKRFLLEPAARFAREFADAQDFVLYEPKDLIQQTEVKCDLENKIADAAEKFLSQSAAPESSMTTVRVAEIATEADFQFVNAMGGAMAANAEILDILNMVEGVYEGENGLTFLVTFQHAWTAPDSYPQSDTLSVLFAFKDYWNANFPVAHYPRDLAHLFSDKQSLRGQGRAVMNATCRPDVAYGMHGRLAVDWLRITLPAHEIAHNFNANHAESGQGCSGTVMNSALSNLTPLNFCPLSRTEIANYVAGTGNSCLTPRPLARSKFDFDGDDRADQTVFRPSSGYWFILNSSLNGFRAAQFGTNGDRPVAEDYDGDGRTDIAVYRGGMWFILQSQSQTFRAFNFGNATDTPAPADFSGDGRAEIAVFRPNGGFWYTLDLTNNSFSGAQFGTSGDVPVPADYDGDGRTDISIFRPSNGIWARINSLNAQFSVVYFGLNGDRPIPGDYDGDGRADIGVFRPSPIPSATAFYVLKSQDNSLMATIFGDSTDVPVPADYDGDGRTDISVFRPSNGGWYRLNSSNNQFAAVQFGANGDIPAQAR